MTITLEFLAEQQKRIIDEMREMRTAIGRLEATVARIEHQISEVNQDLASLARVMLRLESRINALEEARAQ